MAVEVPAETARKDLSDFPVIGFRIQKVLLFPLARLEICFLGLDRTSPKGPGRRRRQHVDALEKRSILEHASTRNKFPQAAGIRPPPLGADSQNRLGLHREIERLFRLVIVEAVHGIAIVKERRCSASAVREEPLKSSIQALGEEGIVFINMNQIRRPLCLKLMTALLEALDSLRFWIFLAGKHKGDVASLVLDWHSVRE